ncbi:hypothetical protein T484DRAFT_2457036 [Baffinella frigidus]|nr:hypothetical protein T484DRAFT_2457036 [Cryptophyta sp. CCMP2293]
MISAAKRRAGAASVLLGRGADIGTHRTRHRPFRAFQGTRWTRRPQWKAASAFEKEVEIVGSEPLEELAFWRGLETDYCIKNYILQWGMEDAKPLRYEESYMELRDWIMKIIDDLKYELAELLYPVFVHCFLELVQKQYSVEARELLSHYRHEHEPEFTEEITVLAGVMDAGQLYTNPVALRFLGSSKTKVFLCHEADKMLTEFLHNKRLHILVRLINQHIDVVVYGATVADSVPSVR